jgi:gag-polypeptide of LTR copia-type
VASVLHIGMAPLDLLIARWTDRNDIAYNQILLCVSRELQTAIDNTDQAKDAWDILVWKFKLADPSKISIVRTQYDNYHMVEGQSVVTYMITMEEYRWQLKKMGEIIALTLLLSSETSPNRGNSFLRLSGCTHKLSSPSISNVLGFKDDPNWDSDMSIWATLKDPEDKATDYPKASNRKHKKQHHNSEIQSYSLMAVYEKSHKGVPHVIADEHHQG